MGSRLLFGFILIGLWPAAAALRYLIPQSAGPKSYEEHRSTPGRQIEAVGFAERTIFVIQNQDEEQGYVCPENQVACQLFFEEGNSPKFDAKIAGCYAKDTVDFNGCHCAYIANEKPKLLEAMHPQLAEYARILNRPSSLCPHMAKGQYRNLEDWELPVPYLCSQHGLPYLNGECDGRGAEGMVWNRAETQRIFFSERIEKDDRALGYPEMITYACQGPKEVFCMEWNDEEDRDIGCYIGVERDNSKTDQCFCKTTAGMAMRSTVNRQLLNLYNRYERDDEDAETGVALKRENVCGSRLNWTREHDFVMPKESDDFGKRKKKKKTQDDSEAKNSLTLVLVIHGVLTTIILCICLSSLYCWVKKRRDRNATITNDTTDESTDGAGKGKKNGIWPSRPYEKTDE
ncbi:unnamed protein product, partial [Mesorhabditis spiculigera]